MERLDCMNLIPQTFFFFFKPSVQRLRRGPFFLPVFVHVLAHRMQILTGLSHHGGREGITCILLYCVIGLLVVSILNQSTANI